MTVLGNMAVEDRTHEVIMPIDDYEAQRVNIITWLVDNFGYDDDSGLWDLWEWESNKTAYFTFHHERDAMAFKLAWT